jgi:hypothetical protein
MRHLTLFPGVLLAGVTMLCMSGWASAEEVPPPPSAGDIKACVKQMDIGDKWRFDWKSLEVGVPRHPRNSYEALYAPAGAAFANMYGYPVHVVFSVNGRAHIDAVYWLVRDAAGHWTIPAICTMR